MVIKITGTPVPNPQRAPAGNEPVQSARPADGPGKDELTLTDSASRLLSLERGLANTPEEDGKRVENIRQQLENGSYKVDAQQAASKLLEFESALFRKS